MSEGQENTEAVVVMPIFMAEFEVIKAQDGDKETDNG